ncbi:ATP-dependent DNA helicase RecQ [compost metagenome]
MTQKFLIEQNPQEGDRKRNEYRKLQQMIEYCYQTSCLRWAMLDYFGEAHDHKPCGICSSCRDERELVDMTRDAQIVFSCIHRMRERFGVSLVASVLKGSQNKKVLQYGFDALPTYGMLRTRTEKEISELINVFIAEGYLALSEGQYPVVRLQPLAVEVLKSRHQVMMRAPEPSAPSKSSSGSRRRGYDEGPSAVNETVFEQLRLIRRDLAEKEHVPSYIIFNDATLREMSVVCPTHEADMLRIKGVGEVKYRKYGKPFLEFFQNME